MAQVMEETQAALKKATEDMKRFHDVHKGESLNLQVIRFWSRTSVSKPDDQR